MEMCYTWHETIRCWDNIYDSKAWFKACHKQENKLCGVIMII